MSEKKYAKIINEETHEVQIGAGCPVGYYVEIGMTLMDVEYGWDYKWYEKGYVPEKPLPKIKTREEVSETREKLYAQYIDPITAHIQRLKDKEQTDNVKEEINRLIQERDNKFIEIQINNPYPLEVE